MLNKWKNLAPKSQASGYKISKSTAHILVLCLHWSSTEQTSAVSTSLYKCQVLKGSGKKIAAVLCVQTSFRPSIEMVFDLLNAEKKSIYWVLNSHLILAQTA